MQIQRKDRDTMVAYSFVTKVSSSPIRLLFSGLLGHDTMWWHTSEPHYRQHYCVCMLSLCFFLCPPYAGDLRTTEATEATLSAAELMFYSVIYLVSSRFPSVSPTALAQAICEQQQHLTRNALLSTANTMQLRDPILCLHYTADSRKIRNAKIPWDHVPGVYQKDVAERRVPPPGGRGPAPGVLPLKTKW